MVTRMLGLGAHLEGRANPRCRGVSRKKLKPVRFGLKTNFVSNDAPLAHSVLKGGPDAAGGRRNRYVRATQNFVYAGRVRPGSPLLLDGSMVPAQPFHDYLLHRLLEDGKAPGAVRCRGAR